MRQVKFILASATAVTFLMSAAMAQQAMTGTVTQINRLNGMISIQETQNGTVGASGGAGGAIQQFKVQDGQSLENVHAGDRVTFSVVENNGAKMISKIQRQ
jgi:Cu/Ag efflux protein CusF